MKVPEFHSLGDTPFSNDECVAILESLKALTKETPEFIAYDYEYGNWSGSGIAVAKVGCFYYYSNLSHCSCYGPAENGFAAFNLNDTSVLSPELSKPLFEWLQADAESSQVHAEQGQDWEEIVEESIKIRRLQSGEVYELEPGETVEIRTPDSPD